MPPNSQAALQQLQSYQSGAQSPEQLITNAQNQLGVGAAQQQVSGLRGAINNTTNLLQQVAPSVMGRTGNSLVTSAQADKIIGNEQAPIQQNLSKDTQDYNDANATYTDLENQAEQRANADLTGQQNQESYLQGIYNDLYTQEQNASQQAEAEREFNVGQANAKSEAASASPTFGLPSSTGPSVRDSYNTELTNLQHELDAGNAPNYETAVSNLVNSYGSKGISSQEIGDYLYQLYGQHFNTSQTKKFYG